MGKWILVLWIGTINEHSVQVEYFRTSKGCNAVKDWLILRAAEAPDVGIEALCIKG